MEWTIDPCMNCLKYQYFKYLCANNSTINMLNQYQNIRNLPPEICPKSDDSNINEQTWFYDFQSLGAKVTCTGSQRIEIKCAFYGYDTLNSKINPNVTYDDITAYYKSSKALQIIGNKCNNLTECVINNDLGSSGDDSQIPKSILQIQWTCFS